MGPTPPHFFRVSFLRRLRPLPFTSRTCRSRRILDTYRCAACAQSWILRSPERPLERQLLVSVRKPELRPLQTTESTPSIPATPTNMMTVASRSQPMASLCGMEPRLRWTPPFSHHALEMASRQPRRRAGRFAGARVAGCPQKQRKNLFITQNSSSG